MLTTPMIAVLCLLPQADSRPTGPPAAAGVRTDANGWPGPPVEAVPAPGAAAPAPAAVEPAPAPPGGAPGALPAGSLDSPLRDVWQWVGQPADFAARGGARAQIALHLYDPTGQLVGTRVVTHEADLGSPRRDRLTFADGRKVFGRDGAAAWAMLDNVIWHSREAEARELLEVMGLLLRVPWAFSDARYVVFPVESVEVQGQRKQRVRVEPRPQGEDEVIGPVLGDQGARYQLICSADRMLPEEVWYRLAGSGEQRRVRLLQYQTLPPGVRVPVRRVCVSRDGRPLLEMEIVRMEFGVELPDDRFRPPVRGGPADDR